jgi:hypothetical protein
MMLFSFEAFLIVRGTSCFFVELPLETIFWILVDGVFSGHAFLITSIGLLFNNTFLSQTSIKIQSSQFSFQSPLPRPWVRTFNVVC